MIRRARIPLNLKLSHEYMYQRRKSKSSPAYHPADQLNLFIHGYLNRFRSSRYFEKEYKRNLELMWLMREPAPDHNIIVNYRKDNLKAIQKIFRATVQLANHFILIGGSFTILK